MNRPMEVACRRGSLRVLYARNVPDCGLLRTVHETRLTGSLQYVPQVTKGTAFFSLHNPARGGIWKAVAVSLSTGAVRWQTEVDGWMELSPIVSRNAVICGTDGGSVHALDRSDGTAIWVSREASRTVWAMTATDSLVVCVSLDQKVYALDARTGRQRWVHLLHHGELCSAHTNPVVWLDNVIYFVESHARPLLRCLASDTGCERWELELPSIFDEANRHAHVSRDLLFLPSINGEVHVVSLATRTFVGTMHGDQYYEPYTPVAIGSILYHRDNGGSIYCRSFGPVDSVDAKPLLIIRTDSAEPGELSVHDGRVYCPSGPWLYVIEPRPAEGIPTEYYIDKYKAPHRFVTGLAHEGDLFCAGTATDKFLIGRLPDVATLEESHSR